MCMLPLQVLFAIYSKLLPFAVTLDSIFGLKICVVLSFSCQSFQGSSPTVRLPWDRKSPGSRGSTERGDFPPHVDKSLYHTPKEKQNKTPPFFGRDLPNPMTFMWSWIKPLAPRRDGQIPLVFSADFLMELNALKSLLLISWVCWYFFILDYTHVGWKKGWREEYGFCKTYPNISCYSRV